jgi:AraC-like DNA-binding protein
MKKKIAVRANDQHKLEELKSIIESNPGADYSIGSLSLRSGINRTKLSYGFKKLFGASLHQFIIAERIAKAKSLLAGSDQPIKAIARDCGYKNVKNFLTAFKKQTGKTASQYQKGE